MLSNVGLLFFSGLVLSLLYFSKNFCCFAVVFVCV